MLESPPACELADRGRRGHESRRARDRSAVRVTVRVVIGVS
jgi:hypothetical protein